MFKLFKNLVKNNKNISARLEKENFVFYKRGDKYFCGNYSGFEVDRVTLDLIIEELREGNKRIVIGNNIIKVKNPEEAIEMIRKIKNLREEI